jgi:hypothetical protein
MLFLTMCVMCSHQMNNILGMIDNAHMALADQSPQVRHDLACRRLVAQHNTAVDFFKTGQSVDRRELISPPKWPDFMGKVREIDARLRPSSY